MFVFCIYEQCKMLLHAALVSRSRCKYCRCVCLVVFTIAKELEYKNGLVCQVLIVLLVKNVFVMIHRHAQLVAPR